MIPKSTEATQIKALLSRKEEETLSEQQKLFVLEYMVDLNQTQAAIRAGVPPHRAATQAARWMKKGHIVNSAAARALAARSARVGITADRVLRELGKVAFGDPRVLFNSDGSLRRPHEYTEDDGAMIEGVKTRRIVEANADGEMIPVEIQEVKITSKLPAITLAMRHLGMLTEKIDVNVTSLAVRLDEAFKRTGRIRIGEDGKPVIEGSAEEVVDEEEDEPLTDTQQMIAARLRQHLLAHEAFPDAEPATLHPDADPTAQRPGETEAEWLARLMT